MSIISSPISIGQVAFKLGEVSGDLGTLCACNKLKTNHSLNRPLKMDSFDYIGGDSLPNPNTYNLKLLKDYRPSTLDVIGNEYTWNGEGETYDSVGYGILVPKFTGVVDKLLEKFVPLNGVFPTWRVPHKKINDGKYNHIAHFIGYDTTAKSNSTPIKSIRCEVGKNFIVELDTMAGVGNCRGFSNLDDFIDGTHYFGVAVYDSTQWNAETNTKTLLWLGIMSDPIAKVLTPTTSTRFVFGIAESGKKYTVVPFVTNKSSIDFAYSHKVDLTPKDQYNSAEQPSEGAIQRPITTIEGEAPLNPTQSQIQSALENTSATFWCCNVVENVSSAQCDIRTSVTNTVYCSWTLDGKLFKGTIYNDTLYKCKAGIIGEYQGEIALGEIRPSFFVPETDIEAGGSFDFIVDLSSYKKGQYFLRGGADLLGEGLRPGAGVVVERKTIQFNKYSVTI